MTKRQAQQLTAVIESIRQRACAAATTEVEQLVLYTWLDQLVAVRGETQRPPRRATAAGRARISPTAQRIT